MIRQTLLNSGNSLRVIPKQNSVNAKLTSGSYDHIDIIQEDHLVKLAPESFAGYLENARIGLLRKYLVRINDIVAEIAEVISRMLHPPRPCKAVADDPCLYARAQ